MWNIPTFPAPPDMANITRPVDSLHYMTSASIGVLDFEESCALIRQIAHDESTIVDALREVGNKYSYRSPEAILLMAYCINAGASIPLGMVALMRTPTSNEDYNKADINNYVAQVERYGAPIAVVKLFSDLFFDRGTLVVDSCSTRCPDVDEFARLLDTFRNSDSRVIALLDRFEDSVLFDEGRLVNLIGYEETGRMFVAYESYAPLWVTITAMAWMHCERLLPAWSARITRSVITTCPAQLTLDDDTLALLLMTFFGSLMRAIFHETECDTKRVPSFALNPATMLEAGSHATVTMYALMRKLDVKGENVLRDMVANLIDAFDACVLSTCAEECRTPVCVSCISLSGHAIRDITLASMASDLSDLLVIDTNSSSHKRLLHNEMVNVGYAAMRIATAFCELLLQDDCHATAEDMADSVAAVIAASDVNQFVVAQSSTAISIFDK